MWPSPECQRLPNPDPAPLGSVICASVPPPFHTLARALHAMTKLSPNELQSAAAPPRTVPPTKMSTSGAIDRCCCSGGVVGSGRGVGSRYDDERLVVRTHKARRLGVAHEKIGVLRKQRQHLARGRRVIEFGESRALRRDCTQIPPTSCHARANAESEGEVAWQILRRRRSIAIQYLSAPSVAR